jgi:hypothetical protein
VAFLVVAHTDGFEKALPSGKIVMKQGFCIWMLENRTSYYFLLESGLVIYTIKNRYQITWRSRHRGTHLSLLVELFKHTP